MAEISRKDLILVLATLPEADGETDTKIRGRLAGVDLSGLDLSGLDLHNVSLFRANLRGCRLALAPPLAGPAFATVRPFPFCRFRFARWLGRKVELMFSDKD